MKKYNDDENNNNIAYLAYTLLKVGYNQLTIILITALQP